MSLVENKVGASTSLKNTKIEQALSHNQSGQCFKNKQRRKKKKKSKKSTNPQIITDENGSKSQENENIFYDALDSQIEEICPLKNFIKDGSAFNPAFCDDNDRTFCLQESEILTDYSSGEDVELPFNTNPREHLIQSDNNKSDKSFVGFRKSKPREIDKTSRQIFVDENSQNFGAAEPANKNRGQKSLMLRANAKNRHVSGGGMTSTQPTEPTSSGMQLVSHPRHPPIQAKQNQMYLITTLFQSVQNNAEMPHDFINRVLPKEIILKIFSYLDIVTMCRCAQVCTSWNKLAMDGSNWQDVDLFYFQKDIKAAVVENLARRCGGFLKVLSLKGCENVQDSAMRLFAVKCPNIERLVLSKCKLVTDAEGCKKLEELNVSWCENITDRGIAYIIKGCPNLISLVCKGCEGLTANCFAELSSEIKHLKKLNLYSCSNVTDETVEQIVSGCPNLEFLCLSNCKEITDQALIAIAHNCPNMKYNLIKKFTIFLRHLELAGCSNLSDSGFIYLSKNCHDIERMDLEDCKISY